MANVFSAAYGALTGDMSGLLDMRQQVEAASALNPYLQQAAQEQATRIYEDQIAAQGIRPGSLDQPGGLSVDTGTDGLLARPGLTDANQSDISYYSGLLQNPQTNQRGQKGLDTVLGNMAQADAQELTAAALQQYREQGLAQDQAQADATLAQNASKGSVGAVPGGFQRVQTPGGEIVDVPITGSEAQVNRSEIVSASLNSIDTLDDLLNMIDGEGGEEGFGNAELFNRDAITRFNTVRAQAMADVFKSQGRGAPQAFEQELIDDQFPKFDDLTNAYTNAWKQTASAVTGGAYTPSSPLRTAYSTQRDIQVKNLEALLANDPTMAPSDRARVIKRLSTEKEKAQARRDVAAERQGLR